VCRRFSPPEVAEEHAEDVVEIEAGGAQPLLVTERMQHAISLLGGSPSAVGRAPVLQAAWPDNLKSRQ